jgi:hypothetical protein
MRHNLLTIVFLVLISGPAQSQDLSFPELPGYKKNTEFPVFKPENLWDFINGAADNYLAYGFADLHVAEYKKGKSTIKLEIYRHSSHDLAFGIYSTERSSSFRFVNLGSQGYIADGAINFFKGNYYVKIRTFSKNEKVRQSAETLATRVSNMLEGSTEMPKVLSEFPPEGKKLNEETYINESVLGHKFLNKAYKAVYEAGADNFAIFIIEANTPEEIVTCAEAYLKATGIEPSGSDDGKYVINDGYNGIIFLSWKDRKMVIISGLPKDQAEVADRYTSEILK